MNNDDPTQPFDVEPFIDELMVVLPRLVCRCQAKDLCDQHWWGNGGVPFLRSGCVDCVGNLVGTNMRRLALLVAERGLVPPMPDRLEPEYQDPKTGHHEWTRAEMAIWMVILVTVLVVVIGGLLAP